MATRCHRKVSPGWAIQQLHPSLQRNNNPVVAFLWLLNLLGKIRSTHPLHSSSLFRVRNFTFVLCQMSKFAFSRLKLTNDETKRTSCLKRWCPAKLVISHILAIILTDSAYQLFSQNLQKATIKVLQTEHSETPNIVFFKTTALLHYLALPAYLLSQNLQRRNIFSFLKIKDKNSKDLARFYLFLIIIRHPKVVTLVYSPLTKSLTFSKSGPSSCCDYFCNPSFLKHNLVLEISFCKSKHLRDVLAKVSLEKVFKSCLCFFGSTWYSRQSLPKYSGKG